ncbi:MAG: DUF1080 domain-containing protein [Phycisphaerales bacterium]|nr:DUF1080 domain-containing protein [Phycisphaerales bacterium]
MIMTTALATILICTTPPAGFKALFNGVDLSGWQGIVDDPIKRQAMPAEELARRQAAADISMRQHWSAKDGILHFDGKGESLCTTEDFGSVDLWCDWRIEKGGDSGIYLRGAPQVQIWDDASGSGGLFNNKIGAATPLERADLPVGEWNRFHIIVRLDRVTVWLNDRLVVDDVPLENYWDRALPLFASGAIELQSHGTPLGFKDIFVRRLGQAQSGESAASLKEQERDERMEWFRGARFGMFIHWGLYSVAAGEWQGSQVGGAGEWIMLSGQIQPADYSTLLSKFNPVRFDADEWVRLAKCAGQQYIVITSKHHDGFCLWDTKETQWSVMHTPFARDILKELAAACARQGMRLCFYHSIMDWTHPDYLPRREWDARPVGDASMERYSRHMKAQLSELLGGGYGDIGIAWFDGEWEGTWTHELGLDLAAHVRSVAPNIIINNRVDKGRSGMQGLDATGEWAGDYGTPEQEVPASGIPGIDWETCMTMNGTWGYKTSDTNWKNAPALIQGLADIASKGGNFLLNVGPQGDGLIPRASVDRLMEIGRWMETNGESIHGTSASPLGQLEFGRCTSKELPQGNTRLYLHIFDWPTDSNHQLILPSLRNEVIGARLLGETAFAVKVARTDDCHGWTFSLPEQAPDDVDSVLMVDIAGTPATDSVSAGAPTG